MAAGSLDIAIGSLPEAPNALIKSTLFSEPFVCIARRGHPALQDGVLSLDRFVEMQHVQALMKDGTMYAAAIDTALANHGLVRKVALWQPSFFALPHVVERTDLISTVPKRVGVHAAENLAIEIHEVPLPLPQPEFALYWHERSRDDLGHRWLRDRIAALMRVQSD